MNGDDTISKRDLETFIHKHGGTSVQYPTRDTFCVIAAREALKVRNLITKGDVDIIHYKWLSDCVQKEALISLEPRYMIYTKPETKAVFLHDIDKYGDSYTADTSVSLLREIFDQVEKQKKKYSAIQKKKLKFP